MDLNSKLNEEFIGKVVRKDLTKSIKEGANVPIYVLCNRQWRADTRGCC